MKLIKKTKIMESKRKISVIEILIIHVLLCKHSVSVRKGEGFREEGEELPLLNEAIK